ncbi:MAG: ribose-5-phosphate isomerase RpiA [Chitinophagaceae bacterium]|nr:MAG: ribose-5-phosphate isomerase RpiA [Chitinophagaceae bacterium]
MSSLLTKDQIKQRLGEYAATLVPDNATIGLGTGTTVYWLIKALGNRVRDGLQCRVVPTSAATQKLAEEEGIPVLSLNDAGPIELTIDGADEADHGFQLIKGGGAALLQEKMVAAASAKLFIIIGDDKYVNPLGRFPLPVEVIPAGWKPLVAKLLATGAKQVILREKNNEPVLTDHGHYILDCHYETIDHPAALNTSIHLLPGVVETGLFIDMADTLVIGYPDGEIRLKENVKGI